MYGIYLILQELAERKFIQSHQCNQDPYPITNYRGTHNQKSREVYCPSCKYVVMTDLPGPKCSQCHSWLIVCPKY